MCSLQLKLGQLLKEAKQGVAALVLVGIHVVRLGLTVWMDWGPSIILLSPLLSWDESRSRRPDLLGLHRPLSSFWQHLYVGMQDPISMAV